MVLRPTDREHGVAVNDCREIMGADAGSIAGRPSPPSGWERLRRVGGILVVFMCLGPPVGAIAVTALMIIAMCFDSGVTNVVGLGLLVLIGGILYGYVVGFIPAAITGAAVGVRQVYFGGAGWRFALGVGVASGLLGAVALEKGMINWEAAMMFCVASVAATLVCWRIVRRWYLGGGAIEGRTAP
jgi:hypothetical protein